MTYRKLSIAAIATIILSVGSIARAQYSENTESVSTQEQAKESLSEKLSAQRAAHQVAAEASAYLKMEKKSAAARLIRSKVLDAMTKTDDWYMHFILELNEQLESKNVLQILGLRQRPHAAVNSLQYKTELGLYGQRTLPASILAVIGPEAIQQGKLADCWFLSTLAVVAEDHPQLIPSMITVNEDASYLVKFPGYPNKIHVKPLAYNSTKAIGARSTVYGDWPFVLECAATAILPEQMRSGGKPNFALRLLLGADSNTYALMPSRNTPVLSNKDLSETIVAAMETKQTVIVATPMRSMLVPNHAYSVINIFPANQRHGVLVTIRNPWGRLGFDPRVLNPDEVLAEEDGRFTLPVALLGNYFEAITVPSNALRSVSFVSTDGSSPPNSSNNSRALPVVPRSYINPGQNTNSYVNPNMNTYVQDKRPTNFQSLPSVPKSYVKN